MNKKTVFAGLFSLLLVFFLASCPDPVENIKEYSVEDSLYNPPPPVSSFNAFSIAQSPVSRRYATASSITPLTVIVSESGNYQYQWYRHASFAPSGKVTTPPYGDSGWKIIDGANQASYLPTDRRAGDYFYYVEVSNLSGSAKSRVVRLQIAGAGSFTGHVFGINNRKLNYVRGVGGTGAIMFREGADALATPDADVEYIDKFMGEIGANILRIMAPDNYLEYITGVQQSNNRDLRIHDPANNFFAVIKRANQYGAYVLASPWTAPAGLKQNNSVVGGVPTATLIAGKAVDYANHLRGFLQWLNANGAPIYAISAVSEPDYAGNANREAMIMTDTDAVSFWNAAGHFTTQRWDTDHFVSDAITGFGGGRATSHVLTMNGEGRNNAAYNTAVIDDATANSKVELFGAHRFGTDASYARYTKITGDMNNYEDTLWTDRENGITFTPSDTGLFVEGKREFWMTEANFNDSDANQPNPAIYNWSGVWPVMNAVDEALRMRDESAYIHWNSQAYSGMVVTNNEGGRNKGDITPRGRAFAHYARFVKETWRLGLSRTQEGDDNFFSFNLIPTPGTSTHILNANAKISAYLDAKEGKFINVVMFTPSLPNGTLAANPGLIRIDLPSGYTAKSAWALKSFGAGEGEYWQDEPVMLSADSKSGFVTVPDSTIISVKFELAD